MKRYADPLPHGAPTRIAFISHPIHPILVPFPIAFLMSVFASDLAYWYLQDPFWARVSLWLAGAGAVTGIIAGAAGTLELLLVSAIRRRAAAWSHFVVAIMLLSVAVANWGMRLPDPDGMVVPWGLYLSGLGTLLVGVAGWLGGTLVFEHQVGVIDDEDEED
ncbi:MAG: DUF2231 domain-containing protein [Haliea sp.]|nr:MAG: DUF2231 domain-containing protein [Haliea sp.]